MGNTSSSEIVHIERISEVKKDSDIEFDFCTEVADNEKNSAEEETDTSDEEDVDSDENTGPNSPFESSRTSITVQLPRRVWPSAEQTTQTDFNISPEIVDKGGAMGNPFLYYTQCIIVWIFAIGVSVSALDSMLV